MTPKLRQQLPAYAATIFPFLCIVIGKGYNYGSILVLVCSLLVLFPINKKNICNYANNYIIVLCFYFFTFLLTVLYTQNSLSDIDRPSRAILAIPIFIVLLRYPPSLKMLTISIMTGAFAVGLIAIYYHINFPYARAFDDRYGGWWTKGYMQIQTGAMASTLSVSCLVVSVYFLKNKQKLFGLISILGSLFSLYASLLSGSRGNWIFFPLALLYITITNRDIINKKIVMLSTTGVLILCSTIGQPNIVHKRINEGIENIELYYSGTNKDTSIGIRFELWKSAIYTFLENPILGVGTKDRSASRKAHGDAGLIDKLASRQIYHAHNQYLENLSMYGIVGLVGLLGILFYPLYVFEKIRRKQLNVESEFFCQLGSTSIIMMLGYCMTQAFFNHNSGITYYVVYSSILLAAALSKREPILG